MGANALVPLPACLSAAVQPVTKQEFGTIFGPAFMHAIGHIAANISFAAVAISLTHTVKTLEPAFNVLLSRFVRHYTYNSTCKADNSRWVVAQS